MSYRVKVGKRAEKQFRKLPEKIQNQIAKKLYTLSDNPFIGDVKKLRGTDNRYRLRSGDYRIIYDVEHQNRWVFVLDIALRKDVYR